MKYSIQWETSGPCYASEVDKGRGADAYRAAIKGHEPALIEAADYTRGNIECPAVSDALYSAIDRAEISAEQAVIKGWADRNADSGVYYRVECDDLPANLLQLMDQEIIETIEANGVGELVAKYAEAHGDRFGEDWAPLAGGCINAKKEEAA